MKRKETSKPQELFGEWQTELYQPPYVGSDDDIPKNDHGNINVYTQEMIPKDCVWIQDLYAKQAAESLGLKYAETCTGFKFRGGRATPNVFGIVLHHKHSQSLYKEIERVRVESERKKLVDEENQATTKWARIFESLLNMRRLKVRDKQTKNDYSVLQQTTDYGAAEFEDI